MAKKRFALVGASGRGRNMYGVPIFEDYNDVAEVVGVFDINPGRAAAVAKAVGGCPTYDSFEALIEGCKPDCIIISTVDKFHEEYIIKGLEAGVQVFSEKPMCITAEQCRNILEAERKYGRKIGMCFNDRYTSHFLTLKQMIPELVGKVYTMNLEWLLGRSKAAGSHGASYFRRWNGYMDLSGGLALTKATHHFDDANWMIGQRPKRVHAFGKLNTYGKNGPFRAKNCRTCPHTEECEFYTSVDNEYMKELFVDNEQYDGYLIDRCAFDEEIDIYDAMTVSVEYDGGALLNYTESAAAAYEGFKLTINGEKGRIEAQMLPDFAVRTNEMWDFIRHYDLNGNITTYSKPKPKNGGDHDGSDKGLRDVLFRGYTPEDPSQKSGALEAAFSVLIGCAANISIANGGKVVEIDDIIGDASLLERDPDFDYTTLY